MSPPIKDLTKNLNSPDLVFPPRPQAMLVLMEEIARQEPDLNRVTLAIQADPALSGAMLKVVNSPAFGLSRKAASISQAISHLGLRNIQTIVAGLALRQAIVPSDLGLERFWDTAEQVAMLCATLTLHIRGIPKDQAYTIGLFHDCGIPMLMQRFPSYRMTLARANRGDGCSFDQVEQEELNTSHAAVGYFVAKSWHLPEDICLAILLHHSPAAFDADQDLPDMVKNFIGLVLLAQHIHHMRMRTAIDVEWERFGAAVLAHFGLDEEDYLQLTDLLQESLAA